MSGILAEGIHALHGYRGARSFWRHVRTVQGGFDSSHGLALLLWGIMLIPLGIMMHPEKPDPNDVILDQALRQATDMDDSVNE